LGWHFSDFSVRSTEVTDSELKLDLLETRRQLVAMRSIHSSNRRVAIEINKLIRKIAHLHQPNNLAHEKRLIKMIAQTWRAVELILSQEPGAARPESERRDLVERHATDPDYGLS
jgi:hypothetical protein